MHAAPKLLYGSSADLVRRQALVDELANLLVLMHLATARRTRIVNSRLAHHESIMSIFPWQRRAGMMPFGAKAKRPVRASELYDYKQTLSGCQSSGVLGARTSC